jgi:hypothetical protein
LSQIDKEKLKTALDTLYDEPSGSYLSGHFISLVQNSRSAAFWPNVDTSLMWNPHQSAKRLLLIHTDLLNIATISIRLIMQQLWRGNECKPRIGDELWRYFASADIDLFFSKYRSIFDNIAQLINIISTESLPSSFNDLIKKAKSGSLSLDLEYVQFILKCDWFETIKKIRDSIEHQAAETNVDYSRDRVLFVVSSLDAGYTQLPGKSLIDTPEIRDGSFSNFELFAGIYVGYLIWFLEGLSSLVNEDLQFTLSSTDKSYHPGFSTIRTWIQCAMKI